MRVPIDAWTDFTCPFCFLATTTLEQVQRELNVDLRSRSFEIRPPDAPPMSAETRLMIQSEHRYVEELLRTQFALSLRPGPIGIGTRLAHVTAKYAESRGKGDAFHAAAMQTYWLEGRSIEEKSVLLEVGAEVGLVPADLAKAWEDSSLAEAVVADQREAAGRGIREVPGLLFAGRRLLSGARPYEELREIVESLQKDDGKNEKYLVVSGDLG
jgi:predicted DsbA family dithiol-disulfide isomerase